MGIEHLKAKKILLVGLGSSGLSVSRFLQREGIAFDVADQRADPSTLQRDGVDSRFFTEFDAALFCRYELLVVSPGLPLSMPAIQAAQHNGVEVIGDIELFAQVVDAPVIAVTGSNGKSTVVAWLAAALEKTSLRAVACGNIGLPALDALSSDVDLYLLELSSFQLETTRSLRPLSASVLNVSEDHMDRYRDIEHYAATKRRIYDHAQFAVVNAGDARTRPDAASASRVICFASHQAADDCVSEREHQGQSWLLAGSRPVIALAELPLPGAHNCANAQAVIALLEPLSLQTAALRQGLKNFSGLPHRTELVRELNGVRWYNDSKGTNVDASCRAIEAMESPVVLIAGGLGKEADFSPLRAPVRAHVKALVLIGRDAQRLYQSLGDLTSCEFADSMQQAVVIAARCASAGDAVLLSPACASFDMFDSFEHRGEVFAEAVLEMAA